MPWKNWSSERLGLALAILAALGFSFKAIFVKLAYAVPQPAPVDSVTLLCLRMASSSLSNAVFIVNRVCHCRPPSPQSNAHGCFHHPSSPLLNTIFADVSFPLPLNAIKHCCPIKYPCLLLPLSIAIVEHRR